MNTICPCFPKRNIIVRLVFIVAVASIQTWPMCAADKPIAKPAAAPASQPSSQPATDKPADPKLVQTTIKNAIAALNKEYQAFKKDPSSSKLRDKSDYFIENKSPILSHTDIINAISSSTSSDPRADLYIRWQLLSGITLAVDAKLAPNLARVYVNAPTPSVRPGLTQESKRALNTAIARGKKADESAFEQALDKQVTAFEEANAMVIDFRDMLNSRMPTSLVAVQAGLADAQVRASCGVHTDTLMKVLNTQILQVAAGANAQELRMLRAELNNMLTKAKSPPKYFKTVEYDEKSKRLSWKEETSKFFNADTLKAQISQLDNLAAMNSK